MEETRSPAELGNHNFICTRVAVVLDSIRLVGDGRWSLDGCVRNEAERVPVVLELLHDGRSGGQSKVRI